MGVGHDMTVDGKQQLVHVLVDIFEGSTYLVCTSPIPQTPAFPIPHFELIPTPTHPTCNPRRFRNP